GREQARVEGDSIVTGVAVQPDGKLVAVGTIDGRLRFFDVVSGAAVGAPLEVGKGAVWQVAFSPDGQLLAVAVDPDGGGGCDAQTREGEVQLWDAPSRRRLGPAIEPGAGSVLSVAFSRDGNLLATGSYAGRLDLWDVATRARHGKPMAVADDGVPVV